MSSGARSGERPQQLVAAAVTLTAVLVVLGVQIKGTPGLTSRVIALAVGIPVVILLSRHKLFALGSVFVYLPVQQTVLAYLYSLGMPAAVARNAGYYKEAVLAGLILALLQSPPEERRRMRAADWAGVVLIAIATFYLVLPSLLTGVLGGQPWFTRFLAWRLNILFVAYFIVVRRLRWRRSEIRTIEACLMTAGALLAVGAIWEVLGRSSYDTFMVDTIQQPRYLLNVLDDVDRLQDTVIVYGDAAHSYVRVGGWMINPLSLGFCLVLPMAVAFRRLAIDRRLSGALTAAAGCAVALTFTLTRSAILAGMIAVAIVVWGGLQAKYARGVGVTIAAVVAVICVAPFVPGTNVANRVVHAVQGTDESADTHSERSSSALERATRTPLGLGLGSNPVTGLRYETSNNVVAEDTYLQVSLELGWAALLAFAVLTATSLRELLAAHRAQPSASAIAALGTGVGLAVGGFFLHVWLDFPTALLFWGFAGVVTSGRVGDPPETDLPDGAEAEPELPATPALGTV